MAKSTTTRRYITVGCRRVAAAGPAAGRARRILPRMAAFDARSERDACAKAGGGNVKAFTIAWTVDAFLDLVASAARTRKRPERAVAPAQRRPERLMSPSL